LSGTRPVVYTYPYFAHAINLPASFGQKYKLWIASYQATPAVPAPWTDWVLWQDSGGTQKLPNGVPVDTDKAKDLSLWDTSPAAPPPDPPPEPAPQPLPPTPPEGTGPVSGTTDAGANIFSTIWNLVSGLVKKN
jgi:hypothetical protein